MGFRPVLESPRPYDGSELTAPGALLPDESVTLAGRPDEDGSRAVYELGPEFFGGEIVEAATADHSFGKHRSTRLPTNGQR